MKNLTMIGSSIFQQWGIPQWKDLHVTNAAVGGTTADYWAQKIKDHISPDVWNYAVYCGSNDLNQGFSAPSIITNIGHVLDAVQKGDGKNQVAYFSIMKAPQKRGKFAVIDQINSAVTQRLRKQDLYIDLNLFINQDPKWYTEDQLHLTEACYREIENTVEDTICRWAV